jgi:F-type H+-transporting ATPase subunit b
VEILQQLGVDQTVFVIFAIFFVVFLILERVYFKPFFKLFEMRHKRTVEDRQAAADMLAQAEQKLEEYQRRLNDARANARSEFETLIDEAKKEEAKILTAAREEAKKISQEASAEVLQQRDRLKKQLEGEIDQIAKGIADKLLVK